MYTPSSRMASTTEDVLLAASASSPTRRQFDAEIEAVVPDVTDHAVPALECAQQVSRIGTDIVGVRDQPLPGDHVENRAPTAAETGLPPNVLK